ncbi:MAG: alanyl-tRNA synthetase, partial [Natronomonas sp.]
ACGGTHVSRTGDIGAIKLRGTERVQDGVVRLTYAAGEAAVGVTQETENALADTAEILDVSPEEVPETARRFFEEWKARGKRIEELKQDLADARAGGGAGEEVSLGDATAVVQRLDGDMDELRATANAIVAEGTVAVLGSAPDGVPTSDASGGSSDEQGESGGAQFVVAVPDGVGVDAGEVVGELAARVGGGGGGPPDFAQGGGPDADALAAALEDAPDILKQKLNA